MGKRFGGALPAGQITQVALGSVIIAVCSWISLPFTIPITMQTFAIYFTICVLGEKKATFSIIAYLLLGVIGVPVFSGMQSGAGVLLGPSGGFLFGFILMPFIAAVFKAISRSSVLQVVGLAIGTLATYLIGSLWYAFVFGGGEGGFISVLTVCVLPFILPDMIKLLIAKAVAVAVKRHI